MVLLTVPGDVCCGQWQVAPLKGGAGSSQGGGGDVGTEAQLRNRDFWALQCPQEDATPMYTGVWLQRFKSHKYELICYKGVVKTVRMVLGYSIYGLMIITF